MTSEQNRSRSDVTWTPERRAAALSRTLVILAGAACVFLGLWFNARHESLSPSNAALIVTGFGFMAVILLVPMLSEFSFTKEGLSFKTRLDEIDRRQLSNEQQLQTTNTDLGEAVFNATAARLSADQAIARLSVTPSSAPSLDGKVAKPKRRTAVVASDDPQAGRWGGKSQANGRQLSATYRERKQSDWVTVTLAVSATDGTPLDGDVVFHLHDSFDPDEEVVKARDGEARLQFSSWGAFTVGVECDGGKTRLELNMADDAGAPTPWKFR